MSQVRRFQFALTWLLMAAFCGLIGFVIIYHYASFSRPLLRFAVVTDAGSTQTRSSLFAVSASEQEILELYDEAQAPPVPLSRLVEVRQLSSCVNGGPVAALQSDMSARRLVDKCLGKFAQHIKRLDFLASSDSLGELDAADDKSVDAQELDEQLAQMEHRVNSETSLHLGATAGMRALRQLNETRAREKMSWVRAALNASSSAIGAAPLVNLGFVDIIEGSQEAAYGWVSANFVGQNLDIKRDAETNLSANSIGTLELGGASAQMAYQVAASTPDEQIRSASLERQHLELFGANYHLATRSDLCLGMSQAVLRLHYTLLRDHLELPASGTASTSAGPELLGLVEVENACLQRAARVSLTGGELGEMLRGACLAPSAGDRAAEQVHRYIATRAMVRFVGTGETGKCRALLDKLVEPKVCATYFSLCPERRNSRPPPAEMPFVTISGYNKALQVLALTPQPADGDSAAERLVGERLGGRAIDHEQFAAKTREFCAIDASEIPIRFPAMKSQFRSVTCMQLVYIDKLLTEFYGFEPRTSWRQIKFLLFPSAGRREDSNEIGWTLGLLLNATSAQLSGADKRTKLDYLVRYHHGASVLFLMRTTILLMLGCVLIAVGVVVAGAVLAKQKLRRSSVYISPPTSYGGTAGSCESVVHQ